MSWDSLFGQSLTGTGAQVKDAADAFGSHYDYERAEYRETTEPKGPSWSEVQPMAGSQFPPVRDPTTMGIPACSALRIRREQNGRDFMNSRMWDNFHATPPTQTAPREVRNDPKFMDMKPEGTRKGVGNYRFQLEYMPDNTVPDPSKNSQNPFLQRLDAAGSDGRNIVREFRDAVVEDNRERDIESSKRMANRQFQDRWLPPQVAEEAAALQAYELLRPKQYFDFPETASSPSTVPQGPN
jgi:hypothetical protein